MGLEFESKLIYGYYLSEDEVENFGGNALWDLSESLGVTFAFSSYMGEDYGGAIGIDLDISINGFLLDELQNKLDSLLHDFLNETIKKLSLELNKNDVVPKFIMVPSLPC